MLKSKFPVGLIRSSLRDVLNEEGLADWTALGRHNRRVKNLNLFGGIVTIVVSGMWIVAYIVRGDALATANVLLSVAAGFAMIWLAVRNRLRAGSIIMAHGLLFTIVISCLAETAAPGVPRSMHMNLLPVVAATYLVFHRDGPYLRAVLPIAGLLLFLAFALDLIPAIPSMARLSGAGWAGLLANHVTSTVGTSIVVVLMQANVNARRAMEGYIRRAIAKGEFHLHYQPQVDALGRMIGVEALLRWRDPTHGNIPPNAFIPIAEETGLIIPIGEWVLRAACAQLREWASIPDKASLTIAVNVSASQFRQPDFVEQVKAIVAISGAPPSALKLELTESALVDDLDTVTRKMRALTQIGISWSLDDFGTGYSSLSSLKHLPFDQVKIDRSFVQDLPDTRSRAIIDTILRLGDSLGLTVIAEGVETEAQHDALRAAGCSCFQGYLFGRPVPIAELMEEAAPVAA
jgi:EAL domain-containing protein (putative c-di-GMP-specific phosphodiesterase class I)